MEGQKREKDDKRETHRFTDSLAFYDCSVIAFVTFFADEMFCSKSLTARVCNFVNATVLLLFQLIKIKSFIYGTQKFAFLYQFQCFNKKIPVLLRGKMLYK